MLLQCTNSDNGSFKRQTAVVFAQSSFFLPNSDLNASDYISSATCHCHSLSLTHFFKLKKFSYKLVL